VNLHDAFSCNVTGGVLKGVFFEQSTLHKYAEHIAWTTVVVVKVSLTEAKTVNGSFDLLKCM